MRGFWEDKNEGRGWRDEQRGWFEVAADGNGVIDVRLQPSGRGTTSGALLLPRPRVPGGNRVHLHPGFGFRYNKIDENVYARKEEFDEDFPWSKKDEKLVGRFSMYPRLGRHAEIRARKNFVDWAENRTSLEDGF